MAIKKEVEIVDIRVDRFEKRYTCTFNVIAESWICGFGGWQIVDEDGYNFWVDVIRQITGKSPEEAMQKETKARAISDFNGVDGLGNLDGTYYVVSDGNKPKVLDNRIDIIRYFANNNIKDLPATQPEQEDNVK